MADPPIENKSEEPKCKYCGKKIIDHDWEEQKKCAQKLAEDNDLWK